MILILLVHRQSEAEIHNETRPDGPDGWMDGWEGMVDGLLCLILGRVYY